MSTVVDAVPQSVAGAAEAAPEPPLTIIERRPGWQVADLGELWRYRELLFFLAWRDVKVRYKQTVLGAAWAVIQPLATMLVFTLFLGRVANAADATVPYPLFVFAGLLPWTFFANAVASAGNSIISNQNLITKVYFPRLIIPTGAVGAGLVDFVIALGVLLILMLCYGFLPGGSALAVPLLAVAVTLAALGVGTLLCALTVAYRDFRHVIPFLVQLWMFATPGIYLQNTDALGGWGRALLLLNPAQGLITNFRAAVLGTPFDPLGLAASLLTSAVLLAAGCCYFRQVERTFADVI